MKRNNYVVIKIILFVIVVESVLPMQMFGHQFVPDSMSVDDRGGNNYKFALRQAILPVSLIGLGTISLAPPTFMNKTSRHITNAVIDMRCNGSRFVIDDYVQYVPLTGSLLLGNIGVKARHSFRDRLFVFATSYATLGVLTNIPKFCIHEERPEFVSHNSFPSGHTATAFMGAELVRIEYGGWYGVGAYTIAVGVGVMRMYNGRHWFHDVVAGAGVGILSARLGEWSCKFWQKVFQEKKKNLVFLPVTVPVNGGYYGFMMECCL